MTILCKRIFAVDKKLNSLDSGIVLSYLNKINNFKKIEYDNIQSIRILNWYIIKKNILEKYIVCKAKEYSTNKIINIVLDKYNYYIYSIDELNSHNGLQQIKSDIDKYKIGHYILLHNYKIISNDYNVYNITNINTLCEQSNKITKDFILFIVPFYIYIKSPYQNNYSSFRWLFALNNINPSGSYKINFKNSYIINDDYIYTNSLNDIFNEEIINDYITIDKFSFDLECRHFGVFPTPETQPISHMCIDLYSCDRKKIFVLINKDLLEDENSNIKCNEIITNNDTYIYVNEIKILKLFQYILSNIHIDYILSYNGNGFDIPYINGRLKFYNMKPLYVNTLFGKIDLIEEKLSYSFKNKFINNIEYSALNGVILCDLYNYTKRMISGLDNYKLETVSKYKLNHMCILEKHDNKIKVTPVKTNINEEYKMFYRALRTANYCFIDNIAHKIIDKTEIITSIIEVYDKEKIIKSYGNSIYIQDKNLSYNNIHRVHISKDDVDIFDKNAYKNYNKKTAYDIGCYCIHDSVLCSLLFDYDRVFDKITAFSYLYLLPQRQAFIYKENKNIGGAILSTMLNEKIILHKKTLNENYKYEGGKVFNPKKRFIKGPIGIFDFNSLYPNIIILANISPEKIVGVIESDSEILSLYIDYFIKTNFKYPQYIYIKIKSKGKSTYIISDNSDIGFIPKILQSGIEQRKKYKALAKENKDNFILFSLYDSLQYATKIIINSIYGLLALPSFYFPSKQCAQMCTGLSRECITYVRDILSLSVVRNNVLYLNKILNVFDKTTYNTTDFNVKSNDSFILDVVYGDTDSLFIEIRNQHYINDMNCTEFFLELQAIINNILPNPLFFEFESVEKAMILLNKKKYVSLSRPHTSNIYVMKTKGCSYIRRDFCKFHKHHVKQIYDTLLQNIYEENPNPTKSAVDYIKTYIMPTLRNTDNLKIDDFILTRNYGIYKENTNVEFKNIINNYNSLNENDKIIPGNRFSYVYGMYKNNTIINDKFNNCLLKNVTSQIIIVDNLTDISNIRISVEIYINRLLTEICAYILSDSYMKKKLIEFEKKDE